MTHKLWHIWCMSCLVFESIFQTKSVWYKNSPTNYGLLQSLYNREWSNFLQHRNEPDQIWYLGRGKMHGPVYVHDHQNYIHHHVHLFWIELESFSDNPCLSMRRLGNAELVLCMSHTPYFLLERVKLEIFNSYIQLSNDQSTLESSDDRRFD